jgi:hypothetical protein
LANEEVVGNVVSALRRPGMECVGDTNEVALSPAVVVRGGRVMGEQETNVFCAHRALRRQIGTPGISGQNVQARCNRDRSRQQRSARLCRNAEHSSGSGGEATGDECPPAER